MKSLYNLQIALLFSISMVSWAYGMENQVSKEFKFEQEDIDKITVGYNKSATDGFLYFSELINRLKNNYNLDVNKKFMWGTTLLHCAVINSILVERILELPGIDVNVQDDYGNTLLHYVIMFGNNKPVDETLKMIYLLLIHKAKSLKNKEGLTPLEILEEHIKHEIKVKNEQGVFQKILNDGCVDGMIEALKTMELLYKKIE